MYKGLGDKVKYVDEDEEGFESRKPEDGHAGWSSAVGIIEGMDERETRLVYDDMKKGKMMTTVAETLVKLKGVKMDKRDIKGIRIRDQAMMMNSKQRSRAKAKAASSKGADDYLDPEFEGDEDDWSDEDGSVD